MSRFRHNTMMRALDLLTRFTNADFLFMMEELGCGSIADRLAKSERTTPKLKVEIARYTRLHPEAVEASRVFRRLLFVRRSHDERYKEQVFT